MKTSTPQFIGQSISFQRSRFEWGKFPVEEKVMFEIVNWTRIKNVKHEYSTKKPTWYCEFVAKLCKSFHGISEGELVILSIPYRTFERAIEPVNLSIKKPIMLINNADNVYVEATKHSGRNLELHVLERREEVGEDTIKAGMLYYDEGEHDE